MDINKLAQGRYIHWGAHCSLYTGKTRAYLIKKGIDHVELNPSHPHYIDKVMPKVAKIPTDHTVLHTSRISRRWGRQGLKGEWHEFW